jgi:hypothetical protein
MPGAVLPNNLKHLTAEDTASIRTRMEEVDTQAAALASSLELLRVPRTPELLAARAILLANDSRAETFPVLEALANQARDPARTPGERTTLWQAALQILPSGFRLNTAPCDLRWQVLGEASDWMLTGAEGEARARGVAASTHAWFGTMGDCARSTPEKRLELLERLVGGLELCWRAEPAEVVQQLRWTLMVESGLMLYGYSSTATDPAMERIWEVLLQATALDDPAWAQQERTRRAR